MRTEEEVKTRFSEVLEGLRKIHRIKDPNAETYEVQDRLVGERNALMWVLEK